MATASSRPRLRAVESIVVGSPEGQLLVLRDTQGVADRHVSMPVALAAVVGRFTGHRSCQTIAREVSTELGQAVPVDLVVRLASELEDALYCEGPRFDDALAHAHRTFASLDVRPAAHAGGAYHGDPQALAKYIDRECLASAGRSEPGRLVGLIAPHIDPWRGKTGYGHAYGALKTALPDEADTFVVLGTSHAPMRQPFALCRKSFETPFGAVPADTSAIDEIAAHAPFDAYADQFNHKREHSLEFQVVFLKHLLGRRPARIVPILCGLGSHQARGSDPARDGAVGRFLDAVRSLVLSRRGRTVVIAGADLAHVGPRFGDRAGYDALERRQLEAMDRASLQYAAAVDAPGFWSHVSADLDSRRVCGLAPVYSLLRMLPEGATGRTFHYEQTVDEEDGSIVSHAAVGFFDG